MVIANLKIKKGIYIYIDNIKNLLPEIKEIIEGGWTSAEMEYAIKSQKLTEGTQLRK